MVWSAPDGFLKPGQKLGWVRDFDVRDGVIKVVSRLDRNHDTNMVFAIYEDCPPRKRRRAAARPDRL